MQGRPVGYFWKKTGFIVAVVVLSVAMLAGTAWARYQMTKAYGMQYEAKRNASVYLGLGVDAAGNLIKGQGTWVHADGGRVLDFVVSNGESAALYDPDPQKVSVRLVSSLGCDLSGADVVLYVDGEGPRQGRVRQIAENSPLYKSFGPGWFVEFPDADGKEATWTLEGGQLSWLSARLEIQNGELLDTTQLRLQVAGDKSIRY